MYEVRRAPSSYRSAIYRLQLGSESKNQVRFYRHWSVEDDRFVSDNLYSKLSASEIATKLNRPIYSIYHRARRLRIRNSRWEPLRDYSQLYPIQLARLSGLLDGEGWIGCDPRSKRITIQVTNTDPLMLEQLKDWFGGGIYSAKTAKPRHKLQHRWCLSRRENVKNLITRVLPLLVTKRESALRALQHIS